MTSFTVAIDAAIDRLSKPAGGLILSGAPAAGLGAIFMQRKAASRHMRRSDISRLYFEALDARLAPATFSVASASVVEVDEGVNNMVFAVTRSGDLGSTVSVGYNTIAGTATANVDFIPTSGTLSFGANVTTQNVNVPIFGDYDPEPSETLTLQLTPTVLDRRGPDVQFAARQTIAIGNNPIGVSWADFNSDGMPDAASAVGSNVVSAIVNATAPGSSTVAFANRFDMLAGNGGSDTATADFNLDGKPDLVSITDSTSGVFTFRNDTPAGAAALTFTAQDPISGVALANKSVATGDLNRDGRPDIVVGTSNSQIAIFLNNTAPGASTFAFQPVFFLSIGTIVQGLAIADLNLDGTMDIASAGRTSGNLTVFLNTTPANATTPSFAAGVNFAAGNEPFGVAAGDINRDGMPDLVVTNHSGGTVSTFRNLMAPGAAIAAFATKVDIAVSGSPIGVLLADFNGDGKPELVTGSDTGGAITVWTNATTVNAAAFSFVSRFDISGVQQARSILATDFNGDGKLDLAAGMTAGTGIGVYLNTSNLGLTASDFASTAFTAAASNSHTATGDFNNDGKLDIVAGTTNATVLVNTAAPGALTATFSIQTPAVNFNWFAWTVGDVNRDGRLDLIAGDGVYLNTTPANAATVTFSAKTAFAFSSSIDSVLRVGDFDSDGRLDILSTRKDTAVGIDFRIFLNTTIPGASASTFATSFDFTSGNIDCLDAAVADINLDGKVDVILSTAGDGVVASTRGLAILLNTTPVGTSSVAFGTANRFATTRRPGSVVLGDLNGDGKPDLAFISANPAAPAATAISTYINQTTPGAAFVSLSARQDFVSAAGPIRLVELDGDGRLDIVAVGLAGQQDRIFALQNQTAPGGTTTAFATPLEALASIPNASLAAGDFDNDGRVDLVVGQTGSSLNVAFNRAYLFAPSSAVGTIIDNDPLPDTTAPGVAAVYFNGTLWAAAFQNAAGGGVNGVPAQTGAAQLVTLPWNSINQIRIQFAENVNVDQNDLSVRGLNVANYPIVGFGYDGVNYIGVWTLGGNIDTDRLIIDLDGDSATAVTDLAGNKLAGSWTESVSTFPSTGAAAVDFKFRFVVAVGDVDRNGLVRNADANLVRNLLFVDAGQAGYNAFADIDGNGLIRNADTNAVRSHLFVDPPAGPGPNRPGRSTRSIAGQLVSRPDAWQTKFTPPLPQEPRYVARRVFSRSVELADRAAQWDAIQVVLADF